MPTLCIIIWKLPCKLLRREEKDGYLSTQSLICCCWPEGSIETHICSNELNSSQLQSTSTPLPPSLLPSFPPHPPPFVSFQDHPSVQSPDLFFSLLYTHLFASSFISLPHPTPVMLRGQKVARLYLSSLILSAPHMYTFWLQSITSNVVTPVAAFHI